MPPTDPEGTLRRLTLLVAIATATIACGDDDADAADRDAGAYASLIRAVAPAAPAREDPASTAGAVDRVVYCGPLDEGEPIPLEVQADVVGDLEDVATVRFVDERAEAIDESDDRRPVLEDGVLVLVGPVPAGRTPSVDAERYVHVGERARVRVDLEVDDGEWTVVAVETVGR